MTRIENDIAMCYVQDEDGHKEFDWEAFQYLCDCADYYDVED